MKTIMDAVNELRGDLLNSELFFGDADKYVLYSISRKIFVISCRKNYAKHAYDYICTIAEFKSLVAELQNWQPTNNHEAGDVQCLSIDISFPSGFFTENKDANHKSKFERNIEIELFWHSWIVGIIYDSFDTLHEFDIQSLSLKCYPEGYGWAHIEDLTTMLDSCSSLYQQFECAVIAKLEEERQNV